MTVVPRRTQWQPRARAIEPTVAASRYSHSLWETVLSENVFLTELSSCNQPAIDISHEPVSRQHSVPLTFSTARLYNFLNSFCLCFNGHFPVGPGLASVRMSPFWISMKHAD